MISNNKYQHSFSENITLATQEIICYFFQVIENINKFSTRPDELTSENNEKILTKNQEEIYRISEEINNFITQKIDILKNDKRYLNTDILKLLQYAYISLIDEMLITHNWIGRDYWSQNPLESKIFSSRSSGDVFYENCNRILSEKDYKYRELSLCYYLILCSGFKGKLHLNEDQIKIQQIKTDLYELYHDKNLNNKNIHQCILPDYNSFHLNNNFNTNHKKISNYLIYFNITLFSIFLVLSLLLWIIHSNILSNNTM